MSLLDGRVAIVAGGAAGLGAAICERLALEGANVLVADIDGAAAVEVADQITAQGGTASVEQVDVRDERSVSRMADAAHAMGPVRVLVLSAAVETRTSITDCSDEEWREVVDTNLKGPFLCMRACIPHVRSRGGSVIAMGSTLGLIVAPQYPAHSASKFALTNLCKQAAIEHAPDGIRVNVVAPTATDTGLFMRVSEEAPDPEALRRQVAANLPAGRLGTAEDVCQAVLYLASDHSSYVSGAVLPLDGGLAARRM